MRPGSFALSLLAVPLNAHLLEALEDGPKGQGELRRLAGAPAPTTLRKQLRIFTDLEIACRHPQQVFPGAVEYELGPAGVDLLEVARLLRAWLAEAPLGEPTLGGSAAKGVVKALVEGWNSKIVRAIAARPLSLTDLNRVIPNLAYPSLERRFSALRCCGLIEARPGEGRSTPYGPTHWLRRACAPLMAATQWEQRHASAEGAGERFDFEAAFLLAALGRRFPGEVSGRCRLAVEFRNGSREPAMAGVQLQVAEGRVLAAAPRIEGEVDASACGTPVAWGRALVDGFPEDLHLSGDRHLVREIIEGSHRVIHGSVASLNFSRL